MKTNNEIIIEELRQLGKDSKKQFENQGNLYWLPCLTEKGMADFASSLLSKLNKLDRENLRKILKSMLWRGGIPTSIFEKAIGQILQLIPEEGEVVAEGYLVEGTPDKGDTFNFYIVDEKTKKGLDIYEIKEKVGNNKIKIIRELK